MTDASPRVATRASAAAQEATTKKVSFGIAIALLGIAAGLQTADPTIASTALLESANALDMNSGVQAIAASISTLFLAATVISTGLLADRIGRKLVLMSALALTALGDVVVALSLEPTQFMIGRALAGIGLGAVYGSCFAYIHAIVPQKKIPAAMGIFSAYVSVSVLVFSFLGGTLASVSWRIAYFLIPAASILMLFGVFRFLPTVAKIREARDVAGQVFLGLGVVGLLYGISRVGVGVTDPLTWGPILAGIILLIIFYVVERDEANPFFPVQLLKNPGFLAAIAAGIVFNLMQGGVVIQMANVWQFLEGFSTFQVSMAQLPMTILSMIAMIYFGREMSRKMKIPTVLAICGVAIILGFGSLYLLLLSHDFMYYIPALLLLGFGCGGAVPYGVMVLNLAPPAHFGPVSSARTTIGMVGYTIGVSVSVVLVDNFTRVGVIQGLQNWGVPPTRTGQALDAIHQYTTHPTVPQKVLDTEPLLTGAETEYTHAFLTTMSLMGAFCVVLIALSIYLYRRWQKAGSPGLNKA